MTQQELLNLPETVTVGGRIDTREVWVEGKRLSPAASQKVRNHSPDGFNWGYGGSGPAQLALAILLLYLPVEQAQQYYQSFKFKWVATLPQTDFGTLLHLRNILTEITANTITPK